MTLLARDGVFHYTPYLEIDTIAMIQGTRADVALLCPASLAGQTINVRCSTAVGIQPSVANGHDQGSFFQVEVVALSGGQAVPAPVSQAPLPAYLDDLSNELRFSRGGLKGIMGIGFSSDLNENFGVNGAPFAGFAETDPDVKYLDEFCLGDVYQTKLGGNGAPSNPDGPALSPVPPHPYHQHINHFQIQDSLDPSGTVVRSFEWRDVAPEWELFMRWRPVDFVGDVVVHCHILQHEDRGMMALYNIRDCDATPAPETDAPAPALDTDAPLTPAPETNTPPTVAETDAPPTNAPRTPRPRPGLQTDAPDTDAPPTPAPETDAPETDAPPTPAPDTDAPQTPAPETDVPPTPAPDTDAPPTPAPETDAPPTPAPDTDVPPTDAPTNAPRTPRPRTRPGRV